VCANFHDKIDRAFCCQYLGLIDQQNFFFLANVSFVSIILYNVSFDNFSLVNVSLVNVSLVSDSLLLIRDSPLNDLSLFLFVCYGIFPFISFVEHIRAKFYRVADLPDLFSQDMPLCLYVSM
jgi:hypothetical protein